MRQLKISRSITTRDLTLDKYLQEMTLEEIGDRFGLTRERVRQVKEKALRTLRKTSRSTLLRPYL